MRSVLRTILLLAMGCMALGTRTIASDAYVQANESYAKGDFESARRLYTEALAKAQSDNLWYNLGNTFYRLNEPGRAALAYERALALAPTHAEAAENLKFLREKNAARVLERPWQNRALAAIPPSVAPWLSIGSAWLGFAWAGTALWRRSGMLGIVLGSVVITLAAVFGWGLSQWRQAQAREAIVIVASTEAKAEPSDKGRAAEGLLAGSRVSILSTLGSWHFCILPSGTRGWVPAAGIEAIVTRNP